VSDSLEPPGDEEARLLQGRSADGQRRISADMTGKPGIPRSDGVWDPHIAL
jgi:hypothetical protein